MHLYLRKKLMTGKLSEYLDILKFYIIELPYFHIWKLCHPAKKCRIYCSSPFMASQVNMHGNIFLCCPSWLPTSIGNIRTKPVRLAFNSIQAQRIRMSMYYFTPEKYCIKHACHRMNDPDFKGITDEKLAQERISVKTQNEIMKRKLSITDGPSHILEAISELCNVECLFCWTAYKKNGGHPEILELFEKEVIRNRDTIKALSFSGGEPLIQKHVKHIVSNMADKNDVQFYFTSNLNCIDPEMKELLKKIHCGFHISLNAGTADTYHAIVRKGNWESLMKNWKFLMELRKEKPFPLSTSMVVTTVNYKDILEFLRFSLAEGVDQILLYTMNNDGMNDHLQLTNSNLYELQTILKDPLITEHRSKIITAPLENYVRNRLMNIYGNQTEDAQFKKMDSNQLINQKISNYLAQISRTDRNYAIYGAGLWTRYILHKAQSLNSKMPLMILDDFPSTEQIYSIPVLRPDKSQESQIDEILLGTDSYQNEMKQKIAIVFSDNLKVIELISAPLAEV